MANDDPDDVRQAKDLPWWVRGILYIGVVPYLLLYLVWHLTTTTTVGAERMQETMILMKENLSLHAVSQSSHEIKSDAADAALLRVMLQICVNTAGSADERTGCFKVQ